MFAAVLRFSGWSQFLLSYGYLNQIQSLAEASLVLISTEASCILQRVHYVVQTGVVVVFAPQQNTSALLPPISHHAVLLWPCTRDASSVNPWAKGQEIVKCWSLNPLRNRGKKILACRVQPASVVCVGIRWNCHSSTWRDVCSELLLWVLQPYLCAHKEDLVKTCIKPMISLLRLITKFLIFFLCKKQKGRIILTCVYYTIIPIENSAGR